MSLVAVLAVASGCTKKPKNITPIPGSGGMAVAPTTYSTQPNVIRPTTTTDTGRTFGAGSNTGVRELPTDPNAQNLGNTGGGTPLPLAPIGGDNFTEDATTFASNTVYFDYDKAAVKSSESSKLPQVVDYLKGHPEAKLKVAGHADERGTEEYNRALSERRALAVREQLINKGVPADNITTEPYGEDKPADPGHDEAAWAKNRRAEFILLVPSALK
ncbi:MAG TPA: OmpA family protein [Candidatus Limnocylindria bacterium]|nr:OmpA family protein [Candidatus Limnocylindria bacterium]